MENKNNVLSYNSIESATISKKNSKRSKHLIVVILMSLLLTPLNLKSQWEYVYGDYGQPIISMTTGSDNVIFAAIKYNFLIRSTNSGTNWHQIVDIYNPHVIYSSGSTIFAGSNNSYRSTNNGLYWMQANGGLSSFLTWDYIVKDNYVFTVVAHSFWGDSARIYRSSNNGNDWIISNAGFPFSDKFKFAVEGNNVFFCSSGLIYRSTNDGISWIYRGNLGNISINTLKSVNSVLYAGTSDGVFKSIDAGENWILSSQGISGAVNTLLAVKSNLFAGSSSGFYVSADNGSKWTLFNQGLDPGFTNLQSLTADDNYIYTGTAPYGRIFRRPLSDFTVSVQNISVEVPEKYELEQNYPNPFNPVTNLEFGISKLGFVSLKVYNLLGKEVASLLNESLNPGTYKYKFNAEDLSSGVYFYKLEVDGNIISTKRMTLLK